MLLRFRPVIIHRGCTEKTSKMQSKFIYKQQYNFKQQPFNITCIFYTHCYISNPIFIHMHLKKTKRNINKKKKEDQSLMLEFSIDRSSHSSRSATKRCSGALIDGNMARLVTTGLGLDPPASGSRWDSSLTTGRSVLTLLPTDDILSFHILPSYKRLKKKLLNHCN